MSTLLDSQQFVPLAQLVAQNGVRYFVEANAAGSAIGAETAMRLQLQAHVRDTVDPEGLAVRYPGLDIYDGDAESFMNHVLPLIDGPALFWMDPNDHDHMKMAVMLKEANADEQWFILMKAERVEVQGEFDRNWAGPTELKPRVYRSQMEKDIWYGVVVENEYQLPPVNATDVVIDIGSHIGSFAFHAQRMGSRHVLAFEIDPYHYEAGVENLRGLEGITYRHAAVVRSDDKRPLAVHYTNSWNAFETEGPLVEALPLDEIIGDQRIRFIKLDCEGSEWPILYTCTKLDQVEEIAGEYHCNVPFNDPALPPKTADALCAFLRSKGFVNAQYRQGPNWDMGLFFARRSAVETDTPGKTYSLGN